MIKNLEPAERKTLFAWLIIGIIFFLITIFIKIVNPNIFSKDKVDYSKNTYQILKDYNRYYTVTGTINKYYSFINSKDYTSIVHILNSAYIRENNIDEKNVSNYISQSDKALSYNGNMMCYKELSSGITSYIIKGEEVFMNKLEINKELCYEIILDSNNFTFSIRPIDNQVYGGNCNG